MRYAALDRGGAGAPRTEARNPDRRRRLRATVATRPWRERGTAAARTGSRTPAGRLNPGGDGDNQRGSGCGRPDRAAADGVVGARGGSAGLRGHHEAAPALRRHLTFWRRGASGRVTTLPLGGDQ